LRNGKLLKVRAGAVLKNGWQFLPAAVELDGSMFEPGFALADSANRFLTTAVLQNLLDQGLDALWVRARLKFIFGVDSISEPERVEKSLSYFSFVATAQGDGQGMASVPFECFDYYGKTNLFFSPHEEDARLKASIAEAFWNLVTDGSDLADFEDRAYHSMVGFWMQYGCKGGVPFFSEEDVDYEEEDEGPW
jgi:hypothetical protein